MNYYKVFDLLSERNYRNPMVIWSEYDIYICRILALHDLKKSIFIHERMHEYKIDVYFPEFKTEVLFDKSGDRTFLQTFIRSTIEPITEDRLIMKLKPDHPKFPECVQLYHYWDDAPRINPNDQFPEHLMDIIRDVFII